MDFWRNPFEAPPPLPRAPLPSENPTQVAREATYTPEPNVDLVPPDRITKQDEQRDLPFVFTGNTWEYFRLWVTTQALIFLTLGLYAPWARVRRTRYLARHYRLDGIGFEYRANPRAILRGKLLVLLLLSAGTALAFWNPYLIVPLILLAFLPLAWLLSYSFQFRWQTFRYRNISFGFSPKPMAILWPTLLMGIATATTFAFNASGSTLQWGGLLLSLASSLFLLLVAWPYLTSKLLHHRFSHARWGKAQFRLDATVGEIFRMLFKGGKAFFFGTGILFVLLNAVAVSFVKNIDVRSVLQAAAYLVLTVTAVSFGRTRRLNYALNRLTVGDRLTFVSTMEPSAAAWRTLRYGLASVFTLGLAIPWATIDFARWRTENLLIRLEGDWAEFPQNDHTLPTRGAVMDGLAQEFGIEVGW